MLDCLYVPCLENKQNKNGLTTSDVKYIIVSWNFFFFQHLYSKINYFFLFSQKYSINTNKSGGSSVDDVGKKHYKRISAASSDTSK